MTGQVREGEAGLLKFDLDVIFVWRSFVPGCGAVLASFSTARAHWIESLIAQGKRLLGTSQNHHIC